MEKLLAGFRGLQGLAAHFREEKHLELLAAPLLSEGDLYFIAPERLSRRITKPAPSSMVINGTEISFNDGNGTETMSLDRNPVAKLIVDGFVKILSGDTAALTRLYDMSFSPGAGDAWELHLKPKVAPMNQAIAMIDLSGRGVVIDRMRVAEVGGDDTVTTFTNVDAGHKFSAEEQKRLFVIAP